MTDHADGANSNAQHLRLKLTAVVNYDRNGTEVNELKRLLKTAIHHAYDNSMLTGDSDAEVGVCVVRVDELGLAPAANTAREPPGGTITALSAATQPYDQLLVKAAACEGWSDEEMWAVLYRYVAHVQQTFHSSSDLRQFADFVQAECRQRDGLLHERAALAREVYTTVEHGTESFEAFDLGADLAYLLGAILRGNISCEWDLDRPLVGLLRKHFADDHAVWSYVHLVEADGQDEDSRRDRAGTAPGMCSTPR